MRMTNLYLLNEYKSETPFRKMESTKDAEQIKESTKDAKQIKESTKDTKQKTQNKGHKEGGDGQG